MSYFIDTVTQERRFRHKISGMVVTNLMSISNERQFSSWNYFTVGPPGSLDAKYIDMPGIIDWVELTPIAWRRTVDDKIIPHETLGVFLLEPEHLPIWTLDDLIAYYEERLKSSQFTEIKEDANRTITASEVNL